MIPIASPDLGQREKRRALEVLDSGHLVAGEEVRAFEREFAEFCGAEHGVATANGTAALHTALVALGIGEGDRVVTTPISFIATANAVRLCGAEVVFADIDPETFTLDPDAVEAAVRERNADAILAVHLYGLAADMARLDDIATEYDLTLVEDAAQAHGATYRGERVGSLANASCFSFYPTKNMTTGEGGMILTDRDDVAERARRFINHGRSDRHVHDEVGHNFRMPEIGGAIGRVQLEKLPQMTEVRRANAAALTEELADTPVLTPREPDDRRHVYHQYTVRTQDRNGLRAHLDDHDIDTGVYYPTPIHDQPAYGATEVSAPVAERATDEVLSLPVHPGVGEEDLRRMARQVKRYTTHVRQ